MPPRRAWWQRPALRQVGRVGSHTYARSIRSWARARALCWAVAADGRSTPSASAQLAPVLGWAHRCASLPAAAAGSSAGKHSRHPVPTRSDFARRNSAPALATARHRAAIRGRRVRTAAFARGSTACGTGGTGRQVAAARHQRREMRRGRCLRAVQPGSWRGARCEAGLRSRPVRVLLPLPPYGCSWAAAHEQVG